MTALADHLRPARHPGLWEALAALAATTMLVGVYWKVGAGATAFAAFAAAAVVFGASSPSAFGVTVLVLAPIPSIPDLVGVAPPGGVEPLDLLVVLGLGLAATQAAQVVRVPQPLLLAILANLAVFVVAWWRTYAQDAVDSSELALIVRPALVVITAVVAVKLLPRDQLIRTLALCMAGLLVVVGASIVLQRLGVYSTAYQAERLEALSNKQYGGIMLSGNGSGSIIGIFAVPAFVLLRAVGRERLAVFVLAISAPVLFISASRGGLSAFFFGLLALAIFDRRRGHAAVAIVVAAALAIGYGATAGRAEVDRLWTQTTVQTGSTLNGNLSGRSTIWEEAFRYLDEEPSRWAVGGGLDDFRRFLGAGVLGGEFAAHNAALRLITDGGVVFLAAYVLLLAALWRAGSRGDRAVGAAIKIAIVSALVFGLTHNLDLFSPRLTWLWVLAIAAGIGAAATARGWTDERPRGAPDALDSGTRAPLP